LARHSLAGFELAVAFAKPSCAKACSRVPGGQTLIQLKKRRVVEASNCWLKTIRTIC
jgi:hypothetical protein